MGSAIAYSFNQFDSVIFSLALACTILFQIISNYANDLGDGMKGTDANRIGPDRAIQKGTISISQMKLAIGLLSAFAIICAALLIYHSSKGMSTTLIMTYAVLAVLSILAAITYTMGKKAYGYHGLGDLMVFIFFGLVSVIGVYVLYAKSFWIELLLPAASIGLLSTAVLNLNNMRDYSNDKRSGKNTLVVKMGPNSAKFYHALLIMLSLICMTVFLSLYENNAMFIALVPFAYLLYHLRKVLGVKDPKAFDPELKFVALSTFAITLLFFIVVLSQF